MNAVVAKKLFLKVRPLLVFGGLISLLFWVVARTDKPRDNLDNRAARAGMSEFELAEAQEGKKHVLREAEFADRKAQEAFRGPAVGSSQPAAAVTEPKAQEDKAPEEKAEQKVEAQAQQNESASAKERAAALLGNPAPKPVQVKEEEQAPSNRVVKSDVSVKPKIEAKKSESHDSRRESGKSSGVHLVRSQAADVPQPVRVATAGSPSLQGGSVYSIAPTALAGAMDDDDVTEIVSKRDTYSRGNLLKRGSEYLAIIHDAIEITGSDTQVVNITVYGRLTPYTVTQPFVFVGEAKLSANGRRVLITINGCTDPNAKARTLPCAGVVKGIDGPDGLADKIYSPGVFPGLLRTIGTAGSAYFLSNITSSVTQAGVLMDQTQSNAAWSALSAGWQELMDQSASEIAGSGRTVKVYGGSVVKVFVTKDASLW